MTLCPGCRYEVTSSSIRKFSSSSTGRDFQLYYCSRCDLMFWEPRIIDPHFYSGNKLGYEEFHCNLRKSLPFNSKPFFDFFPHKNGRLLDVGGGDGLFARKAQEMGFEVTMIDFDEKSVKTARKRGVDKAFTYSLEEFVLTCKARRLRFDIISFFEVLEHQEDLESFINNIKELLVPDGWIVGSTPNRDRICANLTRKLDGQDTPPHHFFWWSKKSLRNFFAAHGFHIDIFPAKIDIDATTANLLDFISGKVVRKIKERIISHNFDQPDAEIGRTRHSILFSMKYARRFFLFPAGLLLKFAYDRSGGFSFYFQGHINDLNLIQDSLSVKGCK
ncbi:MAG: class I SAM-dependent methyltransferase [Nitrospirae bacterium]|nr:class I SAM-dependent methyltransferase [Nitrospirota bacterium]